jgi:hypothetical protein
MMQARLHLMMARVGLPEGLWAGPEGTGLVVRSQWGAVTWLGWCHAGTPDGGRVLELQPWRRRGVLRRPQGSGNTEDREVYAWGRVERFDAWSDNARPAPMSWLRWTHRAALAVVERVRCVLCRRGLDQCTAGASDPTATRFVCRDCLGRAGSPAPRAWPRGERRCGFCDTLQDDKQPIHENRGGCLCVTCMAGALEAFHAP